MYVATAVRTSGRLHGSVDGNAAGAQLLRTCAAAYINIPGGSGGLPIRQNRQLPKARHGAGARPVHCEFFLYLMNNLVSDFVTWLKVFFWFLLYNS